MHEPCFQISCFFGGKKRTLPAHAPLTPGLKPQSLLLRNLLFTVRRRVLSILFLLNPRPRHGRRRRAGGGKAAPKEGQDICTLCCFFFICFSSGETETAVIVSGLLMNGTPFLRSTTGAQRVKDRICCTRCEEHMLLCLRNESEPWMEAAALVSRPSNTTTTEAEPSSRGSGVGVLFCSFSRTPRRLLGRSDCEDCFKGDHKSLQQESEVFLLLGVRGGHGKISRILNSSNDPHSGRTFYCLLLHRLKATTSVIRS